MSALADAAGRLFRAAGRAGVTVCTVESCTGGLASAAITDIPGCSAWFSGAVVAYANEVKERLGVPASILQVHGAVSAPAASAMAEAGLVFTGADYAAAVTGIAGPSGGTPDKPVGLVYIAVAGPAGARVEKRIFEGTRREIRESAAAAALEMLARELEAV